MPVGQASAKFGEDAVFVVAPDFHCGHHVVVVQLAELVQDEIGVMAVGEGMLVFQEERKGRGAKQVAFRAEHLGAFQHLHKRVFRAQHGLVHIHLPVHDAPRHQKTLHRIDAFRLDSEFIPNDFHHLQQTLRIHAALGHTAEETVALQIVDSIDIQLTGNQFAEKAFRVCSCENLDGLVQASAVDFVELLHHHQREFLVRNALHDAVFQGVGKRPVTAVVEQNGQGSRLKFLICNVVALAAQQLDGASHEVHGTKAMRKTRVVGSGIHQIGHADLFDTPKPLEIRMFDNVEMQFVRNADETVNRVVEDFLFVRGSHLSLKICRKGSAFFIF